MVVARVSLSSYRSSSAMWLNYISLFPIVNPSVHIGMQWQGYVVVRWEMLLYKVRASESGKSALLIFPPSTTASYTCPLYACPSSLCQTEIKNQGDGFHLHLPYSACQEYTWLICIKLFVLGMWSEFLRAYDPLLVTKYVMFNFKDKVNGFWVGEYRDCRFIIERRPWRKMCSFWRLSWDGVSGSKSD